MAHTTYKQPMLFEDLDAHYVEFCSRPLAEEIAEAMLTLGQVAMDFAQVERVPRYNESSRENDAEHSYMAALAATEIAARYYPLLDAGLVCQFALVHDLVELQTGDVATFTLTKNQLAAKEAAEHTALAAVLANLPPHTANLLARYEAQEEPETQFVKLFEKQLPIIVDIIGPGRKVMEEDYGITTLEQLETTEAHMSSRLRERFPQPQLQLLHAVRTILADQFAVVFNSSTD